MDSLEYNNRVHALKRYLNILASEDGVVSKEIAELFIKNSAWWLTHPSGPIPAPGHSRNLILSHRQWQISFGANSFVIGQAIVGCRRILKYFFDQTTFDSRGDVHTLDHDLKKVVRGCVTNYQGDYYEAYGDDEQLTFGAQAIKISGFIHTIYEIVPVRIGLFPDNLSYERVKIYISFAKERLNGDALEHRLQEIKGTQDWHASELNDEWKIKCYELEKKLV
jgi:hypothetical protein